MTFLGLGARRDFVLWPSRRPPAPPSSGRWRRTPPRWSALRPPRSTSPRGASCTPGPTSSPRRGHPRDSYELVTMFREPLAWLESWWRYRAADDSRRSTADMTFEEFAQRYLAGDDDAPVPRGRTAKFIRAQGGVAVDRIFAVDRPDVWEPWFSARVGAPLGVRAAQRLGRRARRAVRRHPVRARRPLRPGVRRVAPAAGTRASGRRTRDPPRAVGPTGCARGRPRAGQ